MKLALAGGKLKTAFRAACQLSDRPFHPPRSRESPSEQRPLLQSDSAGHGGRGSARLERDPPDLRAPADGPGLLKSQAASTEPEVKTDAAFGWSWWEREARGSDLLWDSCAWIFSGASSQALLASPPGPGREDS